MTAPLFTDRDPCGCERALGHVCRPPWMDENEWPVNNVSPAELQGCDLYTDEDAIKSGPAGAGNTTRDLTRASPDQSREVGYQ